MADVQTEEGKKWLREFQGSEKRMRERIIAIEEEIRASMRNQTTDRGTRNHGKSDDKEEE